MNGFEIPQIRRRVRQAIDQDGLFELGIGLSFLGTTLLVAAGVPYLTGVYTVLILAVFLPFVRGRVTYPRIGYAKPKEPVFPLILLFVLGLAVSTLGVMALVLLVQGRIDSRLAWTRLMPVGFGLFVGGFHLLWGIRNGAWRHYVLSAISVVGGILAVVLSGGNSDTGAGIFFLGFGSLQFVIGIVMLTRFLARHPRPQEVTGDA